MTLPEVQRLLTEWGIACRRESARLCLPRISQIQVMIEHVRREDRLRKGVRRKKMRTAEDREREGKLTAQGKETRVASRPMPVINSTALRMDAIVARLPGWMQATIIRRYLYNQPDRLACRDLKIPKEVYRLRCNAALEYVAELLEKP